MVLDLSGALYKQETLVEWINCLKVELLFLDDLRRLRFALCYSDAWCKKKMWNSCLLSFQDLEVVLLKI